MLIHLQTTPAVSQREQEEQVVNRRRSASGRKKSSWIMDRAPGEQSQALGGLPKMGERREAKALTACQLLARW